jgi:hypothetical protein
MSSAHVFGGFIKALDSAVSFLRGMVLQDNGHEPQRIWLEERGRKQGTSKKGQ